MEATMKKRAMLYVADVPMDLIDLIFVLLPVKTLLRFRCVCKDWYNLIHNPTFISNHNIAHKDDPVKYLICRNTFDEPAAVGKCFFSWDKLLTFGNHSEQEFDFKFTLTRGYFVRFHGSCNGLVCFSLTGYNDSEKGYTLDPMLYIYNPSIRKYRMIKHGRTNQYYKVREFTFGFGLCKSCNEIDDYKIVKFSRYDYVCDLDVYTFSTNSWKKIDIGVDAIVPKKWNSRHYRMNGAPAHGALHWLGYNKTKKEQVIVSLDLQSEILGEVMLPKCNTNSELKFVNSWCLGSFRESLCLLSVYETKMWIWVMKEYGVVESWTILQTFDIKNTISSPVVFIGSQGFMVNSIKGCFSMFDFQDQKWIPIEENPHGRQQNIFRAAAYNESLVLLNEN